MPIPTAPQYQGGQGYEAIVAGLSHAQAKRKYESKYADVLSAQREEAVASSRARTAQLNNSTKLAPKQAEFNELALQQNILSTRAALGKLAKSNSYNYLDKFSNDGSTKHLNNWLKDLADNPVAASINDDILRFDKLTPGGDDDKLLSQYGVQDLQGFYSDPDQSKNLVKFTMADGTARVGSVDKIMQGVGYYDHLEDDKLKKAMARSKTSVALRKGEYLETHQLKQSIAKDYARDKGIPLWQAHKEIGSWNRTGPASASTAAERLAKSYQEEDDSLSYTEAYAKAVSTINPPKAGGAGGSSVERIASKLRDENPDMTFEESLRTAGQIQKSGGSASERLAYARDNETDDLESLEQARAEEKLTTSQRNLQSVEQAEDKLDADFEGSFLDADISTLSSGQRNKVHRQVQRIEQLGGLQLSADEKQSMRSLSQLISLSKTASGITDEEVGLIDSTFRGIKKYASDEVVGAGATNAYYAYRNLLRKSLFGSQVSDKDRQDFNKAMGQLGQQRGPLLNGLQTSLNQLKADVASLINSGNPYVMKFRAGASEEELLTLIGSVDDELIRLGKLGSVNPNEVISAAPAAPAAPEVVQDAPLTSGQTTSLDRIFGAN